MTAFFGRLGAARVAVVCWLALASAAAVSADDKKTVAPIDKRVSALIEQLGSSHYATREKAAAELSQLGLDAFDALHAAQLNPDVEIAERARYLLNSMKVTWSRPGDSADVKRLLKDYSQHTQVDRRTRIDQLARLEGAGGLEALCRLVRFEMSTVLAKEAALAIMTRPQFAEAAQRDALHQAIEQQIGPSKRDVAKWVYDFEKTLDDPAAMASVWHERIAAERKLLNEKREKLTDNKIVRDLYRWQAELLQKLERSDEAIDSVRQMIALSDGSQQQLLEIIDWLMQRKAWPVVDEVVLKFPDKFQTDPSLMYRLAEAQVERGDTTAGEKTSDAAFGLDPPNSRQHLEVAFRLQERGRFAWSEREYRSVIKTSEMLTGFGVIARSMLAEMLHDIQRDADAATALADLVQAMEADEAVAEAVTDLGGRSSAEIISRLHFFTAKDHLANGRIDKARAALEKGAVANPQDADLLIAMYRLPNADDAWKKKTDALITAAGDYFKQLIEAAQASLDDLDNAQLSEYTKIELATNCNQYAWLIGNTRGDFDEAIRLSQRSLEIRPETAGYMDTLGHCYFTKGDLENAVKWQAKAAKLEPHSGQIVRALEQFQKAAAEKKGK
jgi:tetratricopeptide (TPR) repeat protein